MSKFTGLRLTAVLAAAAAVSSCNDASAPPNIRICVDANGQRRADGQCPASGGHAGGGGAHWNYISSRTVQERGVPAVGAMAEGGAGSPDADAGYAAAPDAGMARGGFGGTGEGGGHGGVAKAAAGNRSP